MLDLPPQHTSLTQQEEDDLEEDRSYTPTDESQEVFAQSQAHKIKFGDDEDLINASIVDVDCST